MMKKFTNEIVIVIIASLFFIPYLGNVHLFDWDEINFAEAAREMIVTGDYFKVQIDYKPFWEKPPLFIWMQVLSMKIFGVNDFAARFPNAMAGIITLLTIFIIGKKYMNVKFAWLWVMCYGGTILTLLYFKSGIIDPWFNLFIFLSIYFFSRLTELKVQSRFLYSLLAGLFLGLAVLTKGPVAILIAILCLAVYWVVMKFKINIKIYQLFVVSVTTALVCLLWFGVEMINNGFWFLGEFITYQIRLLTTQDAGHGGPFFYHWIVLLIGCFPASIIMIKAFFMRTTAHEHQKVFLKWMQIMFLVVLILFSLVKTKIVHYSSLCYFPLTFLAAYSLYFMIQGKSRWNKWISYSIYCVGFLLVILLIGFPILMMNKDLWIDLVKDPFAVGNLQASISWSLFDSVGGFVLLAGLIFYLVMNAQHHYRKAIVGLFFSVSIMVFLTSVKLVPKIELFSQGAAIRFYESLQGKDVYVQPMYFKSYAHLFYSRKMPQVNPASHDHEWLKSGAIDKDVYIVVKNTKREEMDQYPEIKLIREENGFLFYLREKRK